MYNILIVTGNFFPEVSANGINVSNIGNELLKRGHNVTYISIAQNNLDKYDYMGSDVYPIKSTKFAKFSNLKKEGKLGFWGNFYFFNLIILRKFKSILNIIRFPNVEPHQSKEALKVAEKLYHQEKFNCIIGVFRPFSSVSVAISMKQKHPEILSIAYYLDLINGATKPSFVPNIFYKKLCYKGEVKAFSKLDYILMAKGGKNIYSNSNYNSVNNKIHYVDFPLFNFNYNNGVTKFDKSKINFVYAGTLSKEYRNPNVMLKILQKTSEYINGIVLHIYGRGDCNSIINKYKLINSYTIIEYGVVPHDQVVSSMQEADFLINISNSKKNIMPSKIFEMFSTGKPIINFISNKNDITIPYFNKYPSVFNFNEWGICKEDLKLLINYIMREKGNQYSFFDIKSKYIENTPEYNVDILEKYIKLYKETANV